MLRLSCVVCLSVVLSVVVRRLSSSVVVCTVCRRRPSFVAAIVWVLSTALFSYLLSVLRRLSRRRRLSLLSTVVVHRPLSVVARCPPDGYYVACCSTDPAVAIALRHAARPNCPNWTPGPP